MIAEDEETGGIRFTVSHHYEGNVRNNWSRSSPARLKRLAQESVTLSTSLPLAYGSTIFVRCDTDRLDIMKVQKFGRIIILVCIVPNLFVSGAHYWPRGDAVCKRLLRVRRIFPE